MDSYNIRSKHILVVASGDGHFLRTICKLGGNTGIGIDPGFNFAKSANQDNAVTFRQEYYSEIYILNGLD